MMLTQHERRHREVHEDEESETESDDSELSGLPPGCAIPGTNKRHAAYYTATMRYPALTYGMVVRRSQQQG
eukprot:674502-Rhodomonas_salina.1